MAQPLTRMIDDKAQSALRSAPDVGNSETQRADSRKNGAREALQAPRGADPKQRPHQDREIPPGERDEIALLHVVDPPQPGSSRATRVAHVSEAPLRALRSQPLKTPASLTTHAPAIGVEGVSPACGLVRPPA